MKAPIALADPAARDPAVAGEKAARLAHAAAAGLPVLPGWVLPVGASEAAIASGARALDRSGPSAAYLAASEAPVLVHVEEAAASLLSADGSLVVRSSTTLDGDGRWSGAFTSYLDVEAPYVPAAVRGCWASAFSRDVLARCEGAGVDVRELRIGVLVQPFVGFDAGGTARARQDGTVVVTGAPEGPHAVVAGRRGALDVAVGADGRCIGPVDEHVTRARVRAAASLARRVAEATGIGVIEWGTAGDEVFLLQVGPAAPVPATAGPGPARRAPRDVPADAERLARLVTAFPGPLGEALVLPWALGMGEVPEARPVGADDPRSAFAEAIALADQLAAGVWAAPSADARERSASVSRRLREGRVHEALRTIRDLRPPDMLLAHRVIGLIEGVGSAFAERGLLPSAPLVWRLSEQELEHAMAGERAVLGRGPDRWEPFVAEVVGARGLGRTGTPVAEGVGAGPLHRVQQLRAIGHPGARGVLVSPLPFPQLSPLLWHAAGLVTGAGSTGAHLFEVARSLGVPAVVGVDLGDLAGSGSLVAVDGRTGRVSVLAPDAPAGRSARSPRVGGALAAP